ncbi:hypothetical protein A8C56_04005 [Niabella ginsenosidivorans]|uniref:DUF3826 domain-containing protein n=1 Tax=Niabella ginsenosidivorans TaxID=1176587 RepID=A0A1A9I0L1_9BACT|nr:hypothetical protein A8C56_04005 [Niabella ginsenosidivorans]
MFFAVSLNAQSSAGNMNGEEAAYRKTINERAYKIVAPLGLKDSATFYKVQAVVAKQYFDLRDLDAGNATAIKAVKSTKEDPAAMAQQLKAGEEKRNAMVEKLHADYLKRLSEWLNAGQIDVIKNGMTYNVLPLTYKGYLEMIPRLTTEERKFIMDALVEAREHAMDAGTSEKKHAWFGKYKGRINNYLSKRGYDMNKESKDWQERIKRQQSGK